MCQLHCRLQKMEQNKLTDLFVIFNWLGINVLLKFDLKYVLQAKEKTYKKIKFSRTLSKDKHMTQ